MTTLDHVFYIVVIIILLAILLSWTRPGRIDKAYALNKERPVFSLIARRGKQFYVKFARITVSVFIAAIVIIYILEIQGIL